MTALTMPAPLRTWLGGAIDWLDQRGRAAWLAATLLAFAVAWPVGLVMLAYIVATKRWSKQSMFFKPFAPKDVSGLFRNGLSAMRPSGNAAFDAYKADTLRRLEEESLAFEEFLKRLREAKDKQEFDAFMEQRAAARATPADAVAEAN